MNYKKETINLLLHELQTISKKQKLDKKQVHLQLINYGISPEEQLKTIETTFYTILMRYYYNKKMEITQYKYLYKINSKLKKENECQFNIKINVPISLDKADTIVVKIIEFLNKKKIQYKIKLSKIIKSDIMIISVSNRKDAETITAYINQDKDISKELYQNNPFQFNDDKVNLTIKNPLSYNEIISKYIYNYIKLCDEKEKEAEIDGLINYIYTFVVDFISKNDLSRELKIISEEEMKPEYLPYLEEITKLIHFNLQNIRDNTESKDKFYQQLEMLKEETYSNKQNRVYDDFTLEKFEQDKKLLKDIINTMSYIYGHEYAKKAILGYKACGETKIEKSELNIGNNASRYITEKNGLRERVEKSRTFRTYINLFSEEELKKEFERIKPKIESQEEENIKTPTEIILEQICKETYLTCENNDDGKMQIAISLIKMQNSEYNCITRNNNAREIAKNYLKPEEIKEIVKKSLEKNGYIIENEEDLYEIYATHIEHLCASIKMGRGKK